MVLLYLEETAAMGRVIYVHGNQKTSPLLNKSHLSALHQHLEAFVAQLSIRRPKGYKWELSFIYSYAFPPHSLRKKQNIFPDVNLNTCFKSTIGSQTFARVKYVRARPKGKFPLI